jgi:cell division protein FtsW
MKRKSVDIPLAIVVTFLLMSGMIMVFSASSMIAEFNLKKDMFFFFKKQLLWGVISVFFMVGFSKIDYRHLKRHGLPLTLAVLSIVLLAGLFVVGIKSHGARRWYHLFFFRFQPSEFAKIGLIIYTAYYLSTREARLKNLKKGLLPLLSILALAAVLIMAQPDLSTTLMILLITGLMIFLSPVPARYLWGFVLSMVPVLIFVLARSSYQWGRVVGWWAAIHNPADAAYQVRQSLIGIGRGGLLGKGLGQSVQKFLFLPDSHTDFIFSILGEEFGFVGTSFILMMFLFIFYRGMRIARHTHDKFGRYLAVGITLNITLYAFINAGVASALLPTTGLPMPFFSYGGSNLIFLAIATGVLLNISRQAGTDLDVLLDKSSVRKTNINQIIVTAE